MNECKVNENTKLILNLKEYLLTMSNNSEFNGICEENEKNSFVAFNDFLEGGEISMVN